MTTNTLPNSSYILKFIKELPNCKTDQEKISLYIWLAETQAITLSKQILVELHGIERNTLTTAEKNILELCMPHLS